MLNYDEGAYWLARIKFKYAYDLYIRLGCIQMFQFPPTMFPNVPGCPIIPAVPVGSIHNDLTYCIREVDAADQRAGKGIKLFQQCTKYSDREIAEMLEVPMWMAGDPLPILEEATT